MPWFRYLKGTESLGINSPNTNYSYPYLKRQINKFTPKDTLQSGTWLFLDISTLDIDTYLNGELDKIVDSSSYIVVYEHPTNDNDFTPVKTIINNGVLYFQTATTHQANTEIEKQYCIYYQTPNIRYIKSVNNGGVSDYQIVDPSTAMYDVNFSEVDLTSFNVDIFSNSFYNFSFINGWRDGISIVDNAKLFLTFSGPSLELYGTKGPSYGKLKLKIIGLPNNEFPTNSIDLDWTEIDCYQNTLVENVLLFSTNELLYRDYNLELEVLNSKNILSSSNSIKISSYSFSYNPYLQIGNEFLTDSVAYVKIGGFR